MSRTPARLVIGATVLAAVALVLALTVGDPDRDADEHADHDPPTPAELVDWDARTVQLSHDRWDVDFCEGDAPALCLTEADGTWGGIELSSWAADELDVLEDAVAAGASEAEALEAFAEDFLRVFAQDRAEGCGAAYRFVPDDPVFVPVAGRSGLRYGFRGVVDGTTVEHIVGHAVIIDDTLHLISTAGLADDGCLGREGEFPITAFDQDTVELIGRIAAASRLPTSMEEHQ